MVRFCFEKAINLSNLVSELNRYIFHRIFLFIFTMVCTFIEEDKQFQSPERTRLVRIIDFKDRSNRWFMRQCMWLCQGERTSNESNGNSWASFLINLIKTTNEGEWWVFHHNGNDLIHIHPFDWKRKTKLLRRWQVNSPIHLLLLLLFLFLLRLLFFFCRCCYDHIVNISLPLHCQTKVNVKEFLLCVHRSYISPFKNRKHDLLRMGVCASSSLISLLFFLEARRERIVAVIDAKKHTVCARACVFWGKKDGEKEKARRRMVLWVIVQNALSFVFIINFFVRRAEWAYSQHSRSVFNSLPTSYQWRSLPAFTFVGYSAAMSFSQREGERENESKIFFGGNKTGRLLSVRCALLFSRSRPAVFLSCS